ncbi:alginate O-acetyltransferase AlgF [bacterium SCSIO 12696]|nr:alginate O-acetyltransferase AlgF [bacterium SCSIO 12696]
MKKHPLTRPVTKAITASVELLTGTTFVIAAAMAVLAASALLLSPKAQSDEAALYDKAPEGSAFIRLVNTTGQPLNITLGDKTLSAESHCQASGFVYLPEGHYATGGWSGHLQSDIAYTLVVNTSGNQLYQQPVFRNIRKGQLAVYNLSSTEFSIVTTKGHKAVFANLTVSDLRARPVNPVKIQLSVQAPGTAAIATAPVIFQPSTTSSLLVCDNHSDKTEQTLVSQWINH